MLKQIVYKEQLKIDKISQLKIKMKRESGGSKLKKLVTFHQNQNASRQNNTTNMTKMSSQLSEYDQNTKSQFIRRKIFNIENCKFMSMKNINGQGTNEQSYAFQPVKKLESQISKMEDILVKTQRAYIRKIKNFGKRFNKECEKQIQLAQRAMELRDQLNKNLRAIEYLKQLVGKQNMQQQTNKKTKSRSSKNRFKVVKSPHKNDHQYFKF